MSNELLMELFHIFFIVVKIYADLDRVESIDFIEFFAHILASTQSNEHSIPSSFKITSNDDSCLMINLLFILFIFVHFL